MDKKKSNKIAILFDDNNLWIRKYDYLLERLKKQYIVNLYSNSDNIKKADLLFLIGVTKKISKKTLSNFKLSLVVHESSLPKGKGFAPIQWQILNNQNKISICLIEASDPVDSGDIFLKKTIKYNGLELYDEIRFKQAKATYNIIELFLKKYPNIQRKQQIGNSSYYPKRNPEMHKLNFKKSLMSQFNMLRISNNDDWPAFFMYKNNKFIIKISKVKKK